MSYCSNSIDVVITSYNQGVMMREAVASVCEQTVLPQRIIIVDDGSTDIRSLEVLGGLEKDSGLPVPVIIHRQQNRGVSAARNTGIRLSQADSVLILDGDDRLDKSFISEVGGLLASNENMVAASSYMETFGVLDAVIRPAGGVLTDFLSRNCCPATHILKRSAYEDCGGYDEAMREGFEDWDFFISMLETHENAKIGIVDSPLIQYRTAASSANIRSMDKRLRLMQYIIEKHKDSYKEHVTEALVGIERISGERLYAFENEILHTIENKGEIGTAAERFLQSPTYGDGGMAAAVRIFGRYGNRD